MHDAFPVVLQNQAKEPWMSALFEPFKLKDVTLRNRI
ncbi:unnamed protein product, partial [marine sediment metagenome]